VPKSRQFSISHVGLCILRTVACRSDSPSKLDRLAILSAEDPRWDAGEDHPWNDCFRWFSLANDVRLRRSAHTRTAHGMVSITPLTRSHGEDHLHQSAGRHPARSTAQAAQAGARARDLSIVPVVPALRDSLRIAVRGRLESRKNLFNVPATVIEQLLSSSGQADTAVSMVTFSVPAEASAAADNVCPISVDGGQVGDPYRLV
jgi:hypothetical protein